VWRATAWTVAGGGSVSDKEMRCIQHGITPWTGQVYCAACGAVWHMNVENPPTAPLCTCGASLVEQDGVKGTARAICRRCYRLKFLAQDAQEDIKLELLKN
jgi:hypothetical protein